MSQRAEPSISETQKTDYLEASPQQMPTPTFQLPDFMRRPEFAQDFWPIPVTEDGYLVPNKCDVIHCDANMYKTTQYGHLCKTHWFESVRRQHEFWTWEAQITMRYLEAVRSDLLHEVFPGACGYSKQHKHQCEAAGCTANATISMYYGAVCAVHYTQERKGAEQIEEASREKILFLLCFCVECTTKREKHQKTKEAQKDNEQRATRKAGDRVAGGRKMQASELAKKEGDRRRMRRSEKKEMG